MSENNGGQAFPLGANEYGGYGPQPGMSLRDYFAAQALATTPGYASEDMATWGAEDFAKHVYAIADAMLAEREKWP